MPGKMSDRERQRTVMSDSPCSIIIEPMKEEDITRVRAIERQCFSYLWPEGSFDREVKNNKVAIYFVAKNKDYVVGYMGTWFILDEIHITTIAVDPQYQNAQIGCQLVLQLMRDSINKGARWATLEVDEGNLKAIHLYEKFGFKRIGKRKDYYDTGRNAIVMWVGSLQNESYRKKLDAIEAFIALKRNEQIKSGTCLIDKSID